MVSRKWVPHPRRVFVVAATGSPTTGLCRWGDYGRESTTFNIFVTLSKLRLIFAQPYRLNCLRIASRNSANNDDVSNVSKIATTRPHG